MKIYLSMTDENCRPFEIEGTFDENGFIIDVAYYSDTDNAVDLPESMVERLERDQDELCRLAQESLNERTLRCAGVR